MSTDSFVVWSDEAAGVGIVELNSKLWAVHIKCNREGLSPGNYYSLCPTIDQEIWKCSGCSYRVRRCGNGFPPDCDMVELESGQKYVEDWVHGWTGIRPVNIRVEIKEQV